MYKQILGYIPSNVIPAVVSFAMIYAYTRLLSPAQFGSFSFVFSGILVVQTSLYYALPIAVLRFYPAAALENRQDALLKETYALFYAISLGVAGLWVCASFILDVSPDDRAAFWLALPLLMFRSAVLLNQAFNRSTNSMGRFNWIECAHATIGFLLGLLAIFLIGRTSQAIILGLLVAAILCSAVDLRLMAVPFRRSVGAIDRASLTRLIAYAWPLAATAITASILQLSDRFLVGTLAGAQMLGIYAVAYSLVERPTTLLCSSISTATFPMAVQALEQHGRDAARLQAGWNGSALLALILPACVGLSLTSPYVAAALVGPEFREGVAALIPIMCVTALLHGLRAHFFDHAFHLAGQPSLMLRICAPAAAANIVLNLLVIPRYGMFGAAWVGFACQAGLVLADWLLGRRVFPLWLPLSQVLRTVAAVIVMGCVLALVSFPLNWLGLLMAVALGASVYVAAGLLLDVGGVRSLLWDRLRTTARRPARVMSEVK